MGMETGSYLLREFAPTLRRREGDGVKVDEEEVGESEGSYR